MTSITFRFKIRYDNDKHATLYSEHIGGRYGKTFYDKGKYGRVMAQVISRQEYASALAHVLLRQTEWSSKRGI